MALICIGLLVATVSHRYKMHLALTERRENHVDCFVYWTILASQWHLSDKRNTNEGILPRKYVNKFTESLPMPLTVYVRTDVLRKISLDSYVKQVLQLLQLLRLTTIRELRHIFRRNVFLLLRNSQQSIMVSKAFEEKKIFPRNRQRWRINQIYRKVNKRNFTFWFRPAHWCFRQTIVSYFIFMNP